MTQTTTPIVQWVTASPLWNQYSQTPSQMQQPLLLRFGSDAFMEELTTTLQGPEPQALSSYVATPKSYRAKPTGALGDWQPTTPQLKLYQPVHGHFNLVAASLVCRLAGLPDKGVDSANGEKISFVMRRLATDGSEMAWLAGSQQQGWQGLSKTSAGDYTFVEPDEELLPLFPINFNEGGQPSTPLARPTRIGPPSNGLRRRLLIGLIPSESRQTYLPAGVPSPLVPTPADLQTEPDPRLEELDARVINPLKDLLKQNDTPALPSSVSAADQIKIANLQNQRQQAASSFLLLDLAEYLYLNFTALQPAIDPGGQIPGAVFQTLYNTLNSAQVDDTRPDNLSCWAAMRTVWSEKDRINGESNTPATLSVNLKNTTLDADTLRAVIQPLLTTTPVPSQPPAITTAATRRLPKFDGDPNTRYILRCVYQRPTCGPLLDDVVSAASQPFVLAPFFDFDAPSRPIRIQMPVDTSIKGLRKFNKNVGIMISDQLRQQMASVTDLKKALDGNLASGESFDLGVICSFSLPIITICALIVLIIFLYLLNIVFWWLPFFRICLPIKFKAG